MLGIPARSSVDVVWAMSRYYSRLYACGIMEEYSVSESTVSSFVAVSLVSLATLWTRVVSNVSRDF